MKNGDAERASDEVFHDQALLMIVEGALAGRSQWPVTPGMRAELARSCREIADELVKVRLP